MSGEGTTTTTTKATKYVSKSKPKHLKSQCNRSMHARSPILTSAGGFLSCAFSSCIFSVTVLVLVLFFRHCGLSVREGLLDISCTCSTYILQCSAVQYSTCSSLLFVLPYLRLLLWGTVLLGTTAL